MHLEGHRTRAAGAAGGQFLRFLLVGGLCTALQYLVLVTAVEWGGVDALVASGTGFALSAALNYLLNRRYTWASQTGHRIAMRRFVLVVGSGLLLNLLGMRLLHGYLHWHYMPAQVLTTVVTLLWNFAWHRHWTFATPGLVKRGS
jgi:putative flippase GtrA